MLFGSPLIDDMYTYPTAILALFSHSQEVGVVNLNDGALLPREAGLLRIHLAGLVLVHLLQLIRLLTLAARRGEEPSQWVVRRRISMPPKKMMKKCQLSILRMHTAVSGGK
jgi:hypothetical protein